MEVPEEQMQQQQPDAQPTFDALVIDDSLTPLERVVEYSRSNIPLQRLVHVRMLADTARAYGFDEAEEHIFPILPPISEDSEMVVRQAFLEQVRDMAHFTMACDRDTSYDHLLTTFLPLVKVLLRDEAPKVRDVAGGVLTSLAKLVRPSELGQYVLTVVLQMGHDDESEQNRIMALKLLNDLAPVLGGDLCKQFAIPELVCLAEDVDLRVRKAAAINVNNICGVCGEIEARERVLPAYVRLSQDDQYWVRRACADSLVGLSEVLSSELRGGVLLTVFEQLVRDESRSVQKAVLEKVGPLIATLDPQELGPGLVGHFRSMAIDEAGLPNTDVDLRRKCAYSFPAVALKIGRGRWSELSPAFHQLVADPEVSVRRSLAFGLHEVARVLGGAAEGAAGRGGGGPGAGAGGGGGGGGGGGARPPPPPPRPHPHPHPHPHPRRDGRGGAARRVRRVPARRRGRPHRRREVARRVPLVPLGAAARLVPLGARVADHGHGPVQLAPAREPRRAARAALRALRRRKRARDPCPGRHAAA